MTGQRPKVSGLVNPFLSARLCLSGGKLHARVGEHIAKTAGINYGVAQGSIFGPLLFFNL